MKRTLRWAGGLAVIFLVLVSAVVGGACYLLNYSLCPEDRGRDEALAWHEMDSIYPGLEAWRDSLKESHRWRDTTIVAPDGIPLHAYWIPAVRATRRTAVVVHGYTDCAVRMMHIGHMYERDMKANLLVPDLRNAGQSGGDHFGMGWSDRLDLKQWINCVPELFGDSVSVVVHGISMGAATTMMLSGEFDVPSYVKAYVEDCGYTSVDDQFAKELQERFGLPYWPLMPVASVICKLRYGWSFEEASAIKQVACTRRPMLFIHGSADGFVPTAMVHSLYSAHKGSREGWLAPGAAHARSYECYPAEYTRRVRSFVKRYAGW